MFYECTFIVLLIGFLSQTRHANFLGYRDLRTVVSGAYSPSTLLRTTMLVGAIMTNILAYGNLPVKQLYQKAEEL